MCNRNKTLRRESKKVLGVALKTLKQEVNPP